MTRIHTITLRHQTDIANRWHADCSCGWHAEHEDKVVTNGEGLNHLSRWASQEPIIDPESAPKVVMPKVKYEPVKTTGPAPIPPLVTKPLPATPAPTVAPARPGVAAQPKIVNTPPSIEHPPNELKSPVVDPPILQEPNPVHVEPGEELHK